MGMMLHSLADVWISGLSVTHWGLEHQTCYWVWVSFNACRQHTGALKDSVRCRSVSWRDTLASAEGPDGVANSGVRYCLVATWFYRWNT